MAKQLYQRRVKVTLATPVSVATTGSYTQTTSDVLSITDLRVKFNIKKTDGKEPNTFEVVVSNMNLDHRNQLKGKGTKIEVWAGYQDLGLARLCRGDSRSIDPVRNGADWDLTIKGAEGERSYQNARVSESFAAGTGAGDVLNYLANASGLQVGNVPSVVLNLTKTFDQGYVVSGPWRAEMDRFLKGLGYRFSLQGDAIQVLLPGQSTNAEIPLISPESGLLGSPEFGSPEKKGKPALVKFQSLLRASTPGALVHLKSSKYDGQVYVKKVEHSGDTHGGEWTTTFEGILKQ